MPELCPISACSGCAACANRCPKDAICMAPDANGFLRPAIDATRCIDCGLCRKACPVLTPPVFSPRADTPFAAWAKDAAIRSASSSGGLFSVFANQVVKNGGAANGVRFDADFTLRHRIVESVDEIAKVRGSKYVQASVGDIYREVERILKSGRRFLFTSTPCQVAGLLAYLGKPYDNLVTCDFVCHGVPSPRAFKDYLRCVMAQRGIDSAVDYGFRTCDGWGFAPHIITQSGVCVKLRPQTDAYFQDFMAGRGYRESCYQCLYARSKRVSDLTIGDFWGVPLSFQAQRHTEKGCSLLLVNTDKGKKFVEKCADELVCCPRSWHECRDNHQLFEPSVPRGRWACSWLYRALRFGFYRLPRRIVWIIVKKIYVGELR